MVSSRDDRRRAYLHIGLPKTGTTFLQEVLFARRSELRDAGMLYPAPYREAMFHAAVELRGSAKTWGLDKGRISGTWARIAEAMRSFDGDAVFSHEILGNATSQQIKTALADLPDRDVHVVLTARDPGRQITAQWQEGVKNGGQTGFAEFLERIRADLEHGSLKGGFWRVQELPRVLSRWTAQVPPENVHVVVAPRPGADRLELWRRFADSLGLDPDAYSTETGRSSNESLGSAQSALLRDVNAALDGRLVRPPYTYVVKRFFAQKVLPRQRSARLSIPADMYKPVRALAGEWVAHIESAGYVVHGDLADLLPVPPDTGEAQVELPYEERYAAATEAIAELLLEISRLRENRSTTLLRRLASEPRVRGVIDRVRGVGARQPEDG